MILLQSILIKNNKQLVLKCKSFLQTQYLVIFFLSSFLKPTKETLKSFLSLLFYLKMTNVLDARVKNFIFLYFINFTKFILSCFYLIINHFNHFIILFHFHHFHFS